MDWRIECSVRFTLLFRRLPRRSLIVTSTFTGMITTFLYAVVSDRAISLTWEQPLPLDMIFDSPFVDWSNRFLPAPSPARHSIYDNQTTIDTSIRVDGHLLPSDNMKGVMTNLLEDDKTKSTPLVVVRRFLLPSPSSATGLIPVILSRRWTPSTPGESSACSLTLPSSRSSLLSA